MDNSFPSATPIPPAPTSRQRFGASFRRFFRVLFALGVGLATLIALLYLEENWRGQRAWNAEAKQMTERGEVFDLSLLVPPPVPDDQNFAMTPFLAPLFDFLPGTQTWRDTNATQRIQQYGDDIAGLSAEFGHWHLGQRTDWPACLAELARAARNTKAANSGGTAAAPPPFTSTNQAEAAAAALAVLNVTAPVLAELRSARQRPQSRFNIRYEEEDSAAILLPHLAVIRKCSRIASLRATAELVLGQSAAALADLDLALDLTDTVRNEPILISHLVRCATLQSALQPLWEGVVDHRWTEAQLVALQRRLGQFDFLADSAFALRGERAFGNSIIAYLRRHPSKVDMLNEGEGGAASPYPSLEIAGALMPRGWYGFEQVNYNRMFNEGIQPGVDVAAHRIDPKAMRHNSEVLERPFGLGWSGLFRHQLMSARLLPALTRTQMKSAAAQTDCDQAILACGLERFRLANGRYPDSLAELAPRFVATLPHDVITGGPMKYRPTDSGRFILYSVGWNETDDGGKLVLGKGKNARPDLTEGDWVWPSP